MTAIASIQLTPEENLLLLTSRPYLSGSEEASLERLLSLPLQWEYVLWRGEFFRTLPLIWYHLGRLHLQQKVPSDVQNYLAAWSELSQIRSQLLFRELMTISAAFDAEGLPYFLLKGTAVVPLFYPDPFIRPMLDLDIMIQPQDALAARQVMLDLGYLHAVWNPDNNVVTPVPPRDIAEYQSDHYELPIFMRTVSAPVSIPAELVPRSWRRKHLKCYIGPNQIGSFPVFVDLHLNLSLDFDLADVWAGVSREPIFGHALPVQSPTGMIWFLAARLYHEAFQFNTFKLSMFGDLHTILHQRGQAIEWDCIIAVAEKYGMQPSLFYVLAQLKQITGVAVPTSVLDRLRPDQLGVPRSHDWGDLIPRLFSRVVLYDVVPAA